MYLLPFSKRPLWDEGPKDVELSDSDPSPPLYLSLYVINIPSLLNVISKSPKVILLLCQSLIGN